MGSSGVIDATILDALRAMEPTDLPVGALTPIPAFLRQLVEKEMPEPIDLFVKAEI